MEHGFYSHTFPGQYINAAVNASGLANGFLGPVPEGYCWYVERLTCWSNSSNNSTGILEIFVLQSQTPPNDNSRQGRQDVAVGNVVQNGVSDERSPIYVPAGHFLVASWSLLNSADQVALSCQIRVHKLHAKPTHPAVSHHHMPGGEQAIGHFRPTGDEPEGQI